MEENWMSITKKMTLSVTAIVFFSVAVLGITNYFFSYRETLKSAGVELTGCASITTGIETPEYLMQVKAGKLENQSKLEKQVDWIVQHKKIFAEAYILDTQGKLIVADQHARQLGFKRGTQFKLSAAALRQIKSGKTYYTGIYELRGRRVITGYAPVYRTQSTSMASMPGMSQNSGKGAVIAINAIDFDGGIVSARTWEMNKFVILLSVILPLLAAMITMFFVRRLTIPIKKIGRHVEKVAQGDLSLKPLEITAHDELGQLAHDFNGMVAQLQRLIGNVASTSQKITLNSQELIEGSQKAQAATVQSATQLAEANESVTQQSVLTQQANEDLGQMSLQFKAISTHIETAAHQANKTKRLSQAGNTVVKNTIAQMDRIKQNSTELQQLAAGLNEKAKAIDQVMTLINGISKQTNLLALNASIEAARSENTQGQGFTVVSDEIRKLSEQTGQATLEVAEVVTKIQKDAALSVAKTIAGATSVATGITLINQTSASFTQISDKSNETSQHLARLAREILQLHAKMDSIVGEIAHITSFAAGIAANTNKISEAGRQQKETMQEFVTVSAELSQIAAQLLALVNEFKYKKIN
ncbi:hypothetical protein FD50_GL000645 [Liquorilactobacillus satsumensis DSM 16230 = JCM 12392]|uniref:Methyl-accepting chemotaxis protein n=2 Tax=Liquorilactobacillus satsumensis TaxID=259059 RepID=A0A0R1UZS1_9LACO|nr:hypothetical protein FD50_GL000645 [Liquorilactobacillus satsumensis DSM 16230 = JCM 12392]